MGVQVELAGVDVTALCSGFTWERKVCEIGTAHVAFQDHGLALRPSTFAPVVLTVDGTAKFRGKVASVSMATEAADQVRIVSIVAQNANARLKRVVLNGVIPAGSLKAALEAYASNFAQVGITVDPSMGTGPTLEEIGVGWSNGHEFCRVLSQMTGWLFEVADDTLVLTFWPVGGRVAPLSFTVPALNIDAGLGWEEDAAEYCNDVWVIFGGSAPEGTEKTERFEGNGSTRVFTPRHWVKARPTQVYDEQTATYKNVGLKGIDTLFEWVWDDDHARLEQLAEAPPGTPHAALTSGQFITTTFAWLTPQAVHVTDAAEIAARATGDDPGIYGAVITEDAITDIDAAMAAGQAFMRRSVVTPQRVTLPTRTPGASPGATTSLVVSEQALSGPFLIQGERCDYRPLMAVPSEDPEVLEARYFLSIVLDLVGGTERLLSDAEWWQAQFGAGGSSASSGAVSGGGVTPSTSGPGRICVDLGGSRSDVVTGGTLAQPVPQYRTVYLDPAWFTGGVATLRFEVQTLNAGTSVTPQLRRVDTGAVVAAGSATVSTTWEQQTVLAAIPVAGFYRMYLVRGNSSASARGMGALHA